MDSEYLVISCSLSPQSKSRVLALAVYEALGREVSAGFLDARNLPLPFCDASTAYEDPNSLLAGEMVKKARCVILGLPIYNYSISGWVKNFIELTGEAWNDKVTGFLCAAGGHRSYMSVLHLANSLMLDFDCIIIPSFVYGARFDFDGEKIKEEDVQNRVVKLAANAIRITEALRD